MTELSLRFTSNHEQTPDGPLQVALFWPQSGTASDPQPFTPPLDDQQLADLRWYLEVFAAWPTGPDYERARRIESELEDWGRTLRKSAIHGEAAVRIWQQFVDAAGEKLLTIDAADPRVLRLPWELLADEDGHLFSQGVSVRRRLRQTQRARQRELSLPVRILVLVARPDDAGFIDPRAITRPLLDAVAGLGDAVAVEFLPRPTLQALSQRLRDRDAPPVHVVHFDGHGVYDQKMGLGYLLFENDDHQSDRVDANRLGTLLNQSGVPLMALNACQSAAQAEANPYASVAARLIRAGVGSVLAMNYAVLVVAAHKFTAAFYGALAAGRSVGGAVEAGRFALLEDVARHTITRRMADDRLVDETIRLRDWFLPALYQQADDPVIFTPPPAGVDRAQPAGAPAAEPLPVQTTYPRLVQLLRDRFDEEDLRELCFKLHLRYADVPGATRAAKARELTALLGDAGRLPELVTAARAMRPDAAWDAALDPSAAARALAPHPSAPPRSSPLPPSPPRSSPLPPSPLAPSPLPAALLPPPRHGFHGRSHEILALERAFNAYPIVVLHGFGGLGKTALAAEAGRWFRRTGRFPGGAAFVSFELGGSLEQLCSWVGQTLSGDPDWVIHGDGDLVERVGELLAAKPALLILDNFESVLGRDPLMPAAELKTVLDAVYRWATVAPSPPRPLAPSPSRPLAPSRVLITTRDTTFNDARFAPSRACRHVALRGLAPAEALELAAAVLDDHGIDRAQMGREELQTLLERLGGHPLSLNLVLPHLRDHTPAELTARFEELLPGFVSGAARERNESLAVSLDFSLRRLGDATRAALPDLAVFQGGCMEDHLLHVTEIDPDLWKDARVELEQAALVSAESFGINVPFLRFHPTLLPYLAPQLDDDRRAALETRYRQRYYALANYLYQSDTQTPHQARAIAQRELPNLRRALDLALAAGELEVAVAFSDQIARFLDIFGRWRERDAMLAKVSDEFKVMSDEWESDESEDGGQSAIRNPKSAITKAEFLLQDRQGDTLLQQGRAAQAEELFRALLARLEAGAAYANPTELDYDIAMTQMSIGRCREAQGQPLQAIDWHRRALAGFEKLSGENKSAKKMYAACYVEIADNQAATGQFEQAQQNYQTALPILREVEDDRSVGVMLGQLGTLALARRDLATAQARHREALETFRALGEPQSEAVAWHQLGVVAQQARDWAEAERCYRESLRIKEQQKDLPGVARTCNQLAIVAEGDGRPADAERWYLRAIELGEQLGYNSELGKWLSNLANLLLAQGRLDAAAEYARRALAIKETLDLSAEPWTTYGILAQIAAAQGRAEEARAWRRKEQESYAAYAGAAHQLSQYQPLITAIVKATQGDQQAVSFLDDEYPKMNAGGERWQRVATAIQQVVAGNKDVAELTDEMDRETAYIIHTALAQLAGEAAPAQASEAGAEAAPTAEVSQEVARVRQEWRPVLQAIVAAAQGHPQAAAQLEDYFTQLTQAQPQWRALVGALRRILAGERDPQALLPGLDPVDTLIVRDALAALQPAPAGGGPASAQEAGAVTIEQLLGLVGAACAPGAPAGLTAQVHALTQTLATDGRVPDALRAFGRALNAILSGDRNPDLALLPPELAEPVRGLLAALGEEER